MRRLWFALLATGAVLLSLTVIPSAFAAAVQDGPTAAELLAKVADCDQISDGEFKTDSESSPSIAVCGADGVVFWKADMDIDCDGVTTVRCNKGADDAFQDDTALHTSMDTPLNAQRLPYVVIPQPNEIFDFEKNDIELGAIVAVIFNGEITYAVFGDTGPKDIIGEASFATAKKLGIDPDPSNGGTDSDVTYIVFKGTQVDPVENRNAAVSIGVEAATAFVSAN